MISFLVVLGPFGSPYYLGLRRTMLIVFISIATIIYSIIEQPEAVSQSHLIADPVFHLCVIYALFGLALEIFAQAVLKFSTAFETKPWIPEYNYRIYAEQGTRGEDCPPSTVICPFTSKNGKHQCPECHARVHSDAWHAKEEVPFIKMARNVINHNVFSATVEQTPDDVDNDVYIQRAFQRLTDAKVLMAKEACMSIITAQGTSHNSSIEQFSKLQGNNAFITSTPCCLGCYYQHRYHTLLPRLYYSNLFTSFIAMLIPYTLAVSFDNPIFVDSMRFWAAFCSLLCVVVQLDILGSTCHFINAYNKQYSDEVDRIQKVPRWLRVLSQALKREKFQSTIEDQTTSGTRSFGTENLFEGDRPKKKGPMKMEPKEEPSSIFLQSPIPLSPNDQD